MGSRRRERYRQRTHGEGRKTEGRGAEREEGRKMVRGREWGRDIWGQGQWERETEEGRERGRYQQWEIGREGGKGR